MKNHLLNIFCTSLLTVMLLMSANLSASEIKKGVQHVSAIEAQTLIQADTKIQVLDVRTAEEFNQGHIDGAINIDYYADDFAEQLKALDTETTYLVHCRSGGRSGRTLPILKSIGIKNLIHLDGGIKAWNSAKLPLGS